MWAPLNTVSKRSQVLCPNFIQISRWQETYRPEQTRQQEESPQALSDAHATTHHTVIRTPQNTDEWCWSAKPHLKQDYHKLNFSNTLYRRRNIHFLLYLKISQNIQHLVIRKNDVNRPIKVAMGAAQPRYDAKASTLQLRCMNLLLHSEWVWNTVPRAVSYTNWSWVFVLFVFYLNLCFVYSSF